MDGSYTIPELELTPDEYEDGKVRATMRTGEHSGAYTRISEAEARFMLDLLGLGVPAWLRR